MFPLGHNVYLTSPNEFNPVGEVSKDRLNLKWIDDNLYFSGGKNLLKNYKKYEGLRRDSNNRLFWRYRLKRMKPEELLEAYIALKDDDKDVREIFLSRNKEYQNYH